MKKNSGKSVWSDFFSYELHSAGVLKKSRFPGYSRTAVDFDSDIGLAIGSKICLHKFKKSSQANHSHGVSFEIHLDFDYQTPV